MLQEKPKLKIVELCAGLGAQLRGLQNTGLFDVECVATSEIEKDVVVAYAAIHCGLTNEMIDSYENYPSLDEMRQYLKEINLGYVPEKDKHYDWDKSGKKFERNIRKYWLACQLSRNLGDVSRIEQLPRANVWFLSFPCQSISISGKLKGIAPDSGTRSSLIWQTIRLLQAAKDSDTLPEYLFLENVKNLVGKQFIGYFETFNQLISEFGYAVYWKVINAKETGIPQNRERVFAVYIRKDIDTGNLTWPIGFDNGLRLKDILDDEVDESYYITNQKAQDLIQKLLDEGTIGRDGFEEKEEEKSTMLLKGWSSTKNEPSASKNEIATTLLARDWKGFDNYGSNGVLEKG